MRLFERVNNNNRKNNKNGGTNKTKQKALENFIALSISISIFFRIALSISIFSKMAMSISISIFFKNVDISSIDIRYRYIEQGLSHPIPSHPMKNTIKLV